MDYDIFLSYRRADQAIARDLVEALEARGVGVWWDQKIEAGVDWRDAIVENLIASDVLVILFSDECNSSKQLKKELAMADDMDKTVIPVLIEDIKPKGHFLYELAARNWIQIFPNPEKKIPELAERLTRVAEMSPGGLAGVAPTTPQPMPMEPAPPLEDSSPETAPVVEGGVAPSIPVAPEPMVEKTVQKTVQVRAVEKPSAVVKAAQDKASQSSNPSASKKKDKKLRDFLPFRWMDVIFILPALGYGYHSQVMERSNPDPTNYLEAFAMALMVISGACALIFPIRYYMRKRRMWHAARMYLLSSLFLYALFMGTAIIWGVFDSSMDELLEIGLMFGAVWLAFGAGAFVVYGILNAQRTLRSFRSNVETL